MRTTAPRDQDATATAAARGVELPGLDEQLARLERSMACTT